MGVQIEQGRKKSKKKFSPAFLLPLSAQSFLSRLFQARLIVIFALLFVFMNLNTALAAEALNGTPDEVSGVSWEEKGFSIVLIDGDELYVRSGDSHNFLQGYQLYVKGADPEASKVWIELRRDGLSLQDVIATKGTKLVYSNNSSEILNLTVDTIYIGPEEVLVRFYPVYQYLDPTLSRPQVPDEIISNNSENVSSEFLGSEYQGVGFGIYLPILSLGAAFLIAGFFTKKARK